MKFKLLQSLKTSPLCLSVMLHAAVIIILSLSLTINKIPEIKEQTYSVEILPITKVSNIKTQVKQNDIKKKAVTKAKQVPLSSPPSKMPEKKDKIVKKTDKNKVKTTPKKEDNNLKKNNTKTNKKDDNLDSLLKNLQTADNKKTEKKDVAKENSKGQYNETMPLSVSIQEDIVRQLSKCWNPPAGSRDARNLAVLLLINLEKDGTIADIKIINENLGGQDNTKQASMQAAVRAVKKCSPLTGLPVKMYDSWKELEFYFDPKELIY